MRKSNALLKKMAFCQFFLVFFVLFAFATAQAQVDIRTSSSLGRSASTGVIEGTFTASIDNCSSVATIKIGSSAELRSYSVADARRDAALPDTCLFDFYLSGSAALSPVVNLVHTNGDVKNH
ncbi:MAG: hypothetical protein K0Q67_3174, partial [Cellvibrio sp.]|nr:hypothetical protein [Cellvibrio sp.]